MLANGYQYVCVYMYIYIYIYIYICMCIYIYIYIFCKMNWAIRFLAQALAILLLYLKITQNFKVWDSN